MDRLLLSVFATLLMWTDLKKSPVVFGRESEELQVYGEFLDAVLNDEGEWNSSDLFIHPPEQNYIADDIKADDTIEYSSVENRDFNFRPSDVPLADDDEQRPRAPLVDESYKIQLSSENAKNELQSAGLVNWTNFTNTNDCLNATKVLCGLPPFIACGRNVTNATTTLTECESIGGTIVFIIAILIGGTLIVVANGLVPLVLIFEKTYRNRHNCIKGSLAIVDMLVGWYLLCVALPTTLWIREETQASVLDYVIKSNNTAYSVSMGALLLMTSQLSTLHLLVLSAERFVAIKWPFQHHQLHTRTIWLPILAIWVFCILQACLPAMLKHYFAYQFNSLFLVYFLVIKRTYGDGSDVHGTIYTICTVVLPYVITVLLTISTAAMAWCYLQRNKDFVRGGAVHSTTTNMTLVSSHDPTMKPVENESAKANKVIKDRQNPEVAILKTTSLMVLAFSLSMIPVTVVYLLRLYGYFGEEDCDSYALPSFITFYITIANSLSNVIIYSFRDEKFRNVLRAIFRRIKKSDALEREGSVAHA